MDRLVIEGTEDTPSIDLNPDSKVLAISGRSLPEDVTDFYQPVLDWLDEMESDGSGEYTFNCSLEYFNTASSKLILDILMRLEDIHMEGNCQIKVVWKFDPVDIDMQEAAEEYAELVEIPFEVIPM